MKLILSKFFGIAILSTLLIFSFFITKSQAASDWSIQSPDTVGIVGEYTSIALDVYGNPHISYQGWNTHNSTLKYASWNGNTWRIDTVDSQDWTEGSYTSLVLDSAGYPHISYNDDHVSQLRYARWTGSAWTTENVGTQGDAGSYTSLALDSSGNPSIAYHTGAGGLMGSLKYAKWTGSSWSIEDVDPASQGVAKNVGQCCSLVLDSSNKPHISYYDTAGGLKYASWTGSIWTIETVDSEGGVASSLVLDAQGNPHISYATTFESTPKYASWTGSSWNVEFVDQTASNCQYTSLVLDSHSSPRVAYMDYQQDGSSVLKYAESSGSGWNVVKVDSAGGNFASLSLDAGGNPQVSYWDPAKQDLKYATLAERYQVQFAQTGINNSTQIVLTIDSNNNYKAADLPLNFTWNKGTNHAFSYSSPILNAGSNEKYAWTGTSGLSTIQSGMLSITKSGNISGQYQLQYQPGSTATPTISTAPTGSNDIPGMPSNALQTNRIDVTPLGQIEQVYPSSTYVYRYRNFTLMIDSTANCELNVTVDSTMGPRILSLQLEPSQNLMLSLNLIETQPLNVTPVSNSLNFYVTIKPNSTTEGNSRLGLLINKTELSSELGREINPTSLTWTYWDTTVNNWVPVQSQIDPNGYLVCTTNHLSTWTITEVELASATPKQNQNGGNFSNLLLPAAAVILIAAVIATIAALRKKHKR